jgi:hypothetical protein
VAYATEEILVVLILAGTAALSYSLPIGAAIAVLVAIVTTRIGKRSWPTRRAAAPTSSPKTTSARFRASWPAPRC